jgi:hypothetical protein
VSLHKTLGLAAVLALLVAAPTFAQAVDVGATIGLVNDIGGRFHIDEFKSKDVNLWVDGELEQNVLARLTLGTLRVKGSNAGKQVTLPQGGALVTLPDLTEHIDYVSIGVSYKFAEAGYTSGLFAGFGGYKVRPDSAPVEIANYRDQRETAFGWHAGVYGSMRIVSHLSFVLRLTYHNIRSESGRSLLTANAGFGYRF